jgi:spore germination protein KB
MVSLFPQIEVDNFKPVLEFGIGKPIQGGIILFFTNVVPILMLLMIPRKRVVDKEKYNKLLIIFYILGVIMAFITTFITISILGINLASIYQYPEYIVLKKISLFGFLDRIENIISIQWIFRCFMMLEMVVYYISNSIKKDNKSKLLPFGIIVVIIVSSLWYFKNNTIFSEFILKKYPYINLVLFLLMIVVSIGWLVKKRKLKV